MLLDNQLDVRRFTGGMKWRGSFSVATSLPWTVQKLLGARSWDVELCCAQGVATHGLAGSCLPHLALVQLRPHCNQITAPPLMA